MRAISDSVLACQLNTGRCSLVAAHQASASLWPQTVHDSYLELVKPFAMHVPDIEWVVSAHDEPRVMAGSGPPLERAPIACANASDKVEAFWCPVGG